MCEKNLEQRGIRMEQYKVILVDDEAEVIDIMEAKIRWSELGFEVVGSAKNGVKALELVEKLQPDVVLTDIRMPYMDGLELSRKLNQDYPNIYIILCTGFDEFEYAKEAVHLDIKEYLLKPISAAELSESLMRLKENLDKEREEKLNVRKLENYFQESLPALQSNLFISLMEGRVSEEDYARFSGSVSGQHERSAFLLHCISYFGKPCAGGNESAAVVHVCGERDQTATG